MAESKDGSDHNSTDEALEEETDDAYYDEQEYDDEYYDPGREPQQVESSPFDDAVTVSEEEIVTINVLRNDRTYLGKEVPLKIVGTTEARDGQVAINSDNTITYTPLQAPLPSGYEKAESVRYTASTNGNSTYTGTVTIWIQQVNDPPIAYSANHTIDENMQTLFNLEAYDEDNDSLSYHVISSTTYGTSEVDPYSGTFVYSPLCEFSGKEILTYQVSDGSLMSEVAWIEITVLEVGDEDSCVSSDEDEFEDPDDI